MNKIKIINGKIITPYRIINDGQVIFENGKIIHAGQAADDTGCDEIIDVQGDYIAPGFIDLHSHGGGGHDFMDGTCEAYIGAARTHARHGTTAMLPTTLTSTNEELKNTFRVFKKAKRENNTGAQLLGLHLEGPYFAMTQKGAQDPRYIRNPKREEYEEILSWTDDILRWSAAPELEGAMEFGRFIRNKGILPSIGHSDAIYEQVQEAFENGFTHVTHLYSGMSGVHRRNAYRFAGVIESTFLIDNMTCEVIADGAHLPPCLLQLIYKIKGPSRIALVTDSMRAAGMPEGETILGSLKDGQKVIVEDGVAKLLDRSAFAGSVATTDRLVRTIVQKAGIPLIDAVRMMTATPAEIIGVSDTKGSLVPGKDADIVVFDEGINIKMTIINGRIVYREGMPE